MLSFSAYGEAVEITGIAIALAHLVTWGSSWYHNFRKCLLASDVAPECRTFGFCCPHTLRNDLDLSKFACGLVDSVEE